ncbi:MAG: glutamate synthase large subunit [Deltaproteobacteria bacterium]|nr:MAG: glutamate synthase large subunit [Deltaproteobacteria bacterium]
MPFAEGEQRLPTSPTLYVPDTEHDACGVGFIAKLGGEKSRETVTDALSLLVRMSHRGATGCDPCTGDGAGIMVQLAHRFFKRKGLELGFEMPRRRRYAVGMLFLPREDAARAACEAVIEEVITAEGQRVLGWRDVPVRADAPGEIARARMPVIRQIFIGRRRVAPSAFSRKLYVIRKLVENRVLAENLDPQGLFHICSLSPETIVYKGMLTPEQLGAFYEDLAEPDFVSAIALVHSRFSTNTLPTWDLAQPFRFVAHNGEINTLRGNRNWMQARSAVLRSAKFDGGLHRILPIISDGGSDSAQFDNMLELLHLGGRSLPHAAMMMIPEAFEKDALMAADRRAFYDYSATLMEPWDGPAAIAFTDGHLVGATLDRNGLRPARYIVTGDDRVILASEVGAIDLDETSIRMKGRLRPGRMLIVDTEDGRILDDDAVKTEIVGRFPYARWLAKNEFRFDDLPPGQAPEPLVGEELDRVSAAFGWTEEDLDLLVSPLWRHGKEPIGSMGNDTPLAVLSDQAPTLFDYVKQLFAQVTNPPIDPIREEAVMSLRTFIGGGGNPLEETPEACHRITIESPILTNAQLATLSEFEEGVFDTLTLPAVYDPSDGADALEVAVDALCAAAQEAVDDGYNVLVLSDRRTDARWIPIPSLLALSAVHHHLVREGTRLLTGLVVESGEVREVHHVACLLGFGAGAVNPWLLLDTVRAQATELGEDPDAAVSSAIDGLGKGLMKVMSKMGISTIRSYAGAQLFEIVGLDPEVVDRHFHGAPSRIGGVRLAELDGEARTRHARGFGPDRHLNPDRPIGGFYRWRRRGEIHKWNPATIAHLQKAVKEADADAWRRYTELAADEDGGPVTLRGLLRIEGDRDAIELSEVESVASLLTRFATGAMSFGSISAEAHESLAIAMNRIGGRSNSGEGGEEPERWVRLPNGDLRRSAIKQVASGRFGVHAAYLTNADEIQIKMAQGAKPGEGGQLPGHKVSERIAKVRCSTPGVTLISPPPHHDIYSIEDLAQLIHDLKLANPNARVSVKLVSEVGVGTVAAGVAKAGADAIVIAGASGGTGASPLSSLRHAGLPWELGLAEAHQVLVRNGLRGRVRLQVDGGLRTPRDLIVGALLGAEEFGVATMALIALGCIMLRKCHLNTCSVGVATQDPRLTERFAGSPDHVVQLFTWLAEDLRRELAELGCRTLDEAVGRADWLHHVSTGHPKADTLDLSGMLATPTPAPDVLRGSATGAYRLPTHHEEGQRHPIDSDPIDHLIALESATALQGGARALLELPIANTDRSVGALLSHYVVKAHGASGLPEDSIRVRFTGSAGQSFGAFLARGVTYELVGDANDYVGKGLSGGRLILRPPPDRRYAAEDNILLGNTALYGATGGELYANGVAGERFAVRNSGARAVVEGTGDHGCEYMTGGVVLVLGPVGRNFAAGMSGGIAVVFDRDGSFRDRVNTEMVELEALVEESDLWLVSGMIEDHVRATGSPLGRRILDNWEVLVPRFVKVMPTEYKRVLQERRARRRQRLVGDVA